jgi:hypothetical protein
MSKYAKYLPLVLFSLYSTKLIVLGSSYQDAAVLLVLVLGVVAQEVRIKVEQVGENIQEKLNGFSQELKKFEQNQQVKEKDVQELKTHVAGIKLSNGSRNLNGLR